jgi:hypothetical protein
MNQVWKTKYGPRRVRHDPPTVAEAVAAARGLTDDLQEQVEIAAALIGLPLEQVKPEAVKAAAMQAAAARGAMRRDVNTVAIVSRSGTARAVVVERRPSRRPAAGKLVRR